MCSVKSSTYYNVAVWFAVRIRIWIVIRIRQCKKAIMGKNTKRTTQDFLLFSDNWCIAKFQYKFANLFGVMKVNIKNKWGWFCGFLGSPRGLAAHLQDPDERADDDDDFVGFRFLWRTYSMRPSPWWRHWWSGRSTWPWRCRVTRKPRRVSCRVWRNATTWTATIRTTSSTKTGKPSQVRGVP